MKPVHTVISKKMRLHTCVLSVACALFALVFIGCGGYNGNSATTTPTSAIKKRVLLSNQQIGVVNIMDANKDVLSASTIGAPGAAKMVSSGGFTIVINSSENDVSIIDNTKEQVTQTFATLDRVQDVAVTSNGATAFAAVRNPGILDLINTSSNAGTALSIPSVSRVVASPNGTKILAFVDDPQTLGPGVQGGFPQNAFFVIDTASMSITAIARPGSCTAAAPVTCDQPFSAVFNGSETKAFILNCGAECGGTAGSASVVSLDFSGATPAFGTPISVSGATVGALSGANLFVAGTPPGSASGTLQIINTGTSTPSTAISITDGLHTKMVMASNNRLYIGASSCTAVNDPATGLLRGCLTIFNTNSSALVFPEFTSLRTGFDVTGIQPISNRTVVYVAEGGELDIYDTNTDKLTATQIDIVGHAFDVVQIDP